MAEDAEEDLHPTPDSFWGGENRERFEKKQSKAFAAEQDSCIACGLAIRTKNPSLVLLVDGGSYLLASDVETDYSDSGYMGCFAIGSNCLKDIPARFIRQSV